MLRDCFIGILNMGITASYVILAVLLLRLLLRRLPKVYSYSLWAVVGVRLLCPAPFSSPFSLFNLKLFGTVAAEPGRNLAFIPQNIAMEAHPEVNTGIPAVNGIINRSLPEAQPYTSMNPMQLILYLAGWIWVIGIIALLLYMTVSYLRLKRRVKPAVLLQESRGKTPVYECDGIGTPFVLGIFRPRIYIPFHLNGKEREYILAHEAYHIRRRDPFVKAAAFVLVSVYWFHPLVWVSYFLMGKDMEMSCDEKVVKDMGDEIKQDYSRSLLSFAANTRRYLPGPLAFGENSAAARIKNVLRYKRPAFWIGCIGVLVAGALALVCLTDRKTENTLSVENSIGGEQEMAASCKYSFSPGINSYLIYAEFYDRGDYAGRMTVSAATIEEGNRAGEGRLTLTPLTGDGEGYEGISIGYSMGASLDFISAQLNAPGAAFRMNSGEGDGESFRMEPDRPYVIAEGFFEDETGGEVSVMVSIVISGRDKEALSDTYKEVSLQWNEESPQEDKTQEDNTQGEAAAQESLLSVMDRVFENCWNTGKVLEFGEVPEDWQDDYMIRMAETPDKRYAAYGCYSLEYGYQGIFMNYRQEGGDNIQYLEEVWLGLNTPRMQAADYDGDGREEVALAYPWGSGTGFYVEQLVIFETYDTAHLEPYYFTFEDQKKEIAGLLEVQQHQADMTVDIVKLPDKKILAQGIPYNMENEENVKFMGLDYESQVQFLLEDGKIYMKNDIGILTNARPMPQYEGGGTMTFEVEYAEEQPRQFTLKDPVYAGND